MKTKNTLLLFVLIFAEYSFGVADRSSVIKENLLMSADPLVAAFDGESYRSIDGKALSSTQIAAYLKEKYTNASYDSKTKELRFSTGKGTYVLSSGKEDFETGLDLRVNQVLYAKNLENKTNILMTQTMTFRGNNVRAITNCVGDKVVTAGMVHSGEENNVYCVTATAKVCQRVLNAYNAKAAENGSLASPEEMAGKVGDCTSIMKGYAEVLRSYSDVSPGVAAKYSEMASKDAGVSEGLMKKADETRWSTKNLSLMNNKDEFSKASRELLGSMQNLSKVNQFIELCQINIANFDPDLFDKSAKVPTKTPFRGNGSQK